MLTAIILTTSLVIAVFTVALCKVSGQASRIEESAEWARKWNEQRWEEKWIEQRKQEASINYKWCDDDCLHCEQNDWCKFSEVKKEGQA